MDTVDAKNFGYGGVGNDKVYGTDAKDDLWGDNKDDMRMALNVEDTEGGDDFLRGYGDDDDVWGGYGNDILYGDEGKDWLYGEWGDDKIFGGDGDDTIWGDDKYGVGDSRGPTLPTPLAAASMATFIAQGIQAGKDKLYGGLGNDIIYGGHLEDKIHGGEGDDFLVGGGGEDILFGEEGEDKIYGGYGWDTVFAGPGCDIVHVADGGDVVWLGDCVDDTDPHATQNLYIWGTGRDPENWTVVMDFWLEGAKPWNRICPRPSKRQDIGPAADCTTDVPEDFCLGAYDIFSPGTVVNTMMSTMPGKVQGPGCKHDGGPLWISIPLEDDPVVAAAAGGATYAHTIWARFY